MFEPILPRSAEVRQIAEDALALHQAALEFRREVEQRQAFEDYCQWYYRIAAQNQAEMAAMANDNALWWLQRTAPADRS